LFSEIALVIVHYKHVRPTVATLTALFRHYPEAEVTLVDNSAGECAVAERILPHLGANAARVSVLVNPSQEVGQPAGALSHGGGLDLAMQQVERRFLLSMESDTILLARGGIEFLVGLMAQRYDWAGLAQKPIGDGFASFSPAFAIFRVDLLKAYGLSFRRRPRGAGDLSSDDPLLRHHLLAAEQVNLGLPLTYPEGKPPDTYQRPAERIMAAELQHLEYFDTGEWVHHFLSRKGYRGHLFTPLESVCHVWGSRDESLFLSHFRSKLPQLDVNELLPPELQVPAQSSGSSPTDP
jgi:hypothetical protein